MGTSGERSGLSRGKRIEEEKRRASLLDVVGQVVDLLLGQRRRLGDDQGVEVGGDRRVGRDRAHLVLLLQLGDDRPFGALAHRPHVEAAHHPGVGVEDAHLLAGTPRDHADGPSQLVLDGQAAVEERHDDFLQPRGERHAQDDLRDRPLGLGLVVRGDPLGFDAKPLLGLTRGLGVELGRNQVEADLAPAGGLELPEQVQKVGLGLNVFAGHFRTVVGLDQDRSVVGNLLDERERFGRERVHLLRARVDADLPSAGSSR